jgi:hypothetical protein
VNIRADEAVVLKKNNIFEIWRELQLKSDEKNVNERQSKLIFPFEYTAFKKQQKKNIINILMRYYIIYATKIVFFETCSLTWLLLFCCNWTDKLNFHETRISWKLSKKNTWNWHSKNITFRFFEKRVKLDKAIWDLK